MNWIIFHIGSGHAFFSGVLLVIAGLLVSTRKSTKAENWFAKLSCLLGTILIAISSTPLPFYCYGVVFIATIVWAIAIRRETVPKWGTVALVTLWGLMIVLEMPSHFLPRPTKASSRTLAIIGDSITAGYGGGDLTRKWPALLGQKHDLEILDFSQPGATVSTALKEIKSEQFNAPVVFLEIGGNDLFGGYSDMKFEQDLDALLQFLVAADRQLIMLETPLPPFRNQFGSIQRKLAKKYNVKLVPKRFFLSVITSEGSTVDSLHLSQAGHETMAAMVWKAIEPAFPDNK